MFYGALEIISGHTYYENVDKNVFCMNNRVIIEKDFILEMLENNNKIIMNFLGQNQDYPITKTFNSNQT